MNNKYDDNGVYNTFAHVSIGNGTATLAIRETERKDKPALVELGVAFCSPNEQFSRRIGRTIAEGRLNAKRRFYCVFERNNDMRLKQQAEAMLYHLIDGNDVVDQAEGSTTGWQTFVPLNGQPRIQLPRWVEEVA